MVLVVVLDSCSGFGMVLMVILDGGGSWFWMVVVPLNGDGGFGCLRPRNLPPPPPASASAANIPMGMIYSAPFLSSNRLQLTKTDRMVGKSIGLRCRKRFFIHTPKAIASFAIPTKTDRQTNRQTDMPADSLADRSKDRHMQTDQ